jgi:hypothetical protein
VPRPSRDRLLWVHSSARLRQMGGSEAATCPEKTACSKASTVSPDPRGERQTPGYTIWTPMVSPGPSDIQSGPPRLVPDLHLSKPDPWDGIRTPPPPPPPGGGGGAPGGGGGGGARPHPRPAKPPPGVGNPTPPPPPPRMGSGPPTGGSQGS